MLKVIFIIITFSIFFISFSYSLKLTEIYFDGRTEYVGVYSKNGFSGTILISGAKKSNFTVNLSLKAGEEIILGDKGIEDYFSGFNNFKTDLSLSIADTKAINIQLIYSGQIIDKFFVSEEEVKKLDNKKTSFQKIFSGNEEIIKPVENSVNMKYGYVGNPGYVLFTGNLNNNSQIPENNNAGNNLNNTDNYLDCGVYLIKLNNNQNIKSCTDLGKKEVLTCFIGLKSKENGLYNLYFTGNKVFTGIKWFINNNFYKTGQNLSTSGGYIEAVGNYKNYTCTGNFYIDKQLDNIAGNIFINEVHAGNDKFGEYVELKSFGDFSGNILFSGFLRGNNTFTLPIKTYSGQVLVLAKNYSGFIYTGNIIKISNLSLKDNGGELILKKEDQVLDKVVYKDKNSRYFSYILDGVRYFYKTGENTPGYENFIKNYYPKKEKYFCKILFQSFDKGKINLSSKVSNPKLCNKNYKQVWTYSGGIITGTCNPYSIFIGTGNKNIYFQIFSGKNLLCEDTYNFFYDKEIIKKQFIQTKIEYKKLPFLNCSIKIQGKDDYFFDNDNINLIALINGKEIQNSNTEYTCNFYLDGKLLSNKCNPYSKKFEAGLHNLTLSINSITGLNCQTTMDLNIPKITEDKILSYFTIEDFQNLLEKLKSKYSQKSLKKIIQPVEYLYTLENYIKNLNSDELKNLIENIKNKYSSDTTLKKIFEPISYLFKSSKTSSNHITYSNIKSGNCVKLNSLELKELVKDINNKYKSKRTLKKIFSPIRYLFSNTNLINTGNYNKINFAQFKNIKIVKVIPYFYYNDKKRQALVISGLTGTLLSGFYIGTEKRKYKLSNYILTGKNYLFIGKFGFSKSKCINLYFKDSVLDTTCYIKKGNTIQTFKIKNGPIFKNNYIISNNQVIKNKPLILLKKKIKEFVKIIKKSFKNLKKENKKLKNKNEKLYSQYIKILSKYYILKNKYNIEKEELLKKNKEKYHKLKEKNKQIKNLKNINSFLRSFIIYIKEYIPKDIYRQYLDKYKQVLLGQKIRF